MGKGVPKKLLKVEAPEIMALAEKVSGQAERVSEARERAKKLLQGSGSNSRASKSDLADCTVQAFAGPQGIAARLRLEYEAAPLGSAQRARILTIAYDMVKQNNEDNAAASVESLSDEEIDRELEAFIEGRMNKDAGSPKTNEGRELLFDLLSKTGSDEHASLEKEIKALNSNLEFDVLAVEARKAAGVETASNEPDIDIDEDELDAMMREAEGL